MFVEYVFIFLLSNDVRMPGLDVLNTDDAFVLGYVHQHRAVNDVTKDANMLETFVW